MADPLWTTVRVRVFSTLAVEESSSDPSIGLVNAGPLPRGSNLRSPKGPRKSTNPKKGTGVKDSEYDFSHFSTHGTTLPQYSVSHTVCYTYATIILQPTLHNSTLHYLPTYLGTQGLRIPT